MKTYVNLFRKDSYGFKRDLYKLIDTFTTKGTFRLEAISYYYSLKDIHNFLNSNHSSGENPVIYNMTSNESFIDLYLKAIRIAKVIVCGSFDYLDGKILI